MKLSVKAEGFQGVAEWDENEQMWQGTVLNNGDKSITFRSASSDDLNQAMLDAIAEYELRQMFNS